MSLLLPSVIPRLPKIDYSSTINNISVISLNMHGVNQGITCLDLMCSAKSELIFLQETWLSVDSMIRTFNCFSSDYQLFCSSAMDDKLVKGILKGRSFGGLCVLFHKSFY